MEIFKKKLLNFILIYLTFFLKPVNPNSSLLPGENYQFKINTVSNKVESLELRELEQTLYPNALESVSQLIAANNITFKTLTSLGRVDYYIVVYNTVKGIDLVFFAYFHYIILVSFL